MDPIETNKNLRLIKYFGTKMMTNEVF